MQRQLPGSAAAAVAIVLVAAACGAGGGSARTGAAACQARAPRVTAPARHTGAAGLVRPRPVIVSVCQYAPGLPASKGRAVPLRRIVLRGQAAAGLAAVINGASPVTAHARRCARPAGSLRFPQLLIFMYRTAPRAVVLVAHTACSLAVVTTGTRSGVLSGQAEADLLYYTAATGRARGPLTPRLIGLTARDALRAAGQHRFSLVFDGAAIDPLARAGTVIFQSPPAGIPDRGPGKQVDVILAAHAAPACRARQLALTYLGGGPGAGNDLGAILIRDTSGRACTLTGPLRITGLNEQGSPDTTSVRRAVAGAAVLSPHAGEITRPADPAAGLVGVRPGELVGWVELIAEYRDGPPRVDHGNCTPLWVVPATWRVRFPGGTLSVANSDPASQAKLVPSGGLVTCRGRLGGYGPARVVAPGS